MIDDTAITRRFNLMHLLRARRPGATVREIAGELQASERTVRRDLIFLRKNPYTIVDHKGLLYLFAFDPDHQRVCRYKVDRIEQADLSKSQFKPPVDFDVQKELAGSLGIYGGSDDVTVVVRILPAAARFACESKWHHSQTLTHERDGSVLVRLRLSSTVEIKSKVLSFGANAVVLKPEAFRVEIASELEHLLSTYYSRSL